MKFEHVKMGKKSRQHNGIIVNEMIDAPSIYCALFANTRLHRMGEKLVIGAAMQLNFNSCQLKKSREDRLVQHFITLRMVQKAFFVKPTKIVISHHYRAVQWCYNKVNVIAKFRPTQQIKCLQSKHVHRIRPILHTSKTVHIRTYASRLFHCNTFPQ